MSAYECKDKLHPEELPTQMVQDGWTKDGRRLMVEIITNWNDMPCGHSQHQRDIDPKCAGCRWRDWDHKKDGDK